MEVSVIIINYNTFALTCACIESFISKTLGLKYEIILVDNNSTETDPEAFLKLFPNIVLVKNTINVGFAKGNNAGISKASGRHILLLNSDVVLVNNAVAITIGFLEKNPAVGVVSARLEFPDGKVQHNCQRFPSVKYGLFELLRLQKMLPKQWAGKILFGSFFKHNTIAYPDWVWGTFFLFEKAKLRELPEGKLADDFFMYVEDIQWCKEFKRAGYRIAFEPEAKVIHYMGKSGGTKSELMQQNTRVFMQKYYTHWQILIIDWINRQLTNGQVAH